MTTERLLDVSELAPPEPMERVLETLETLGPGESLRVLHRREPFLLYPILRQRGYVWNVHPGRQTAFEILIWHEENPPREMLAG